MSLLNTYESDVSYFESSNTTSDTSDDYLPYVLNRKYSYVVGHQDTVPFQIKLLGVSTYVMHKTYGVLSKGKIKWRVRTRARNMS